MSDIFNPVMFTAFTNDSRVMTACNLLHCYLEFDGLIPDIKDRTEEKLSDNPPLFYRLQQLNALFHAFEIDGIVSFQSGRFLEQENSLRNAKATAMISDRKILSDESNDLYFCFVHLMNYRAEIEKVLGFGSGSYHIGPKLVWNTFQKIWQFNGSLKKDIQVIDNIIVAFISPEEKSFSVEDLIRDYGYPDVNISQLDMDCL